MNQKQYSKLDVTLASVCRSCPVCRTARRRRTGLAYWLVNRVESSLCPFCRAYERVYGRKSHETGAAHQPQSDT
ncbi:MAG: hypothetical protein KA191_02085 [Verrucomicrobia bacterium]|jgi:hypothetical protein|nr:hypothetical protein [Verrucomicrobiota bacterium]OQC65497.1 MAG: hypothetical protein BWX48_02409 [Verrucomicrobia bacterium ADurb.Bin006]MDI9381880.1 hypothetical protein [Verrucomicrobiota bacterium]NMD20490.1 hypothetical protein [Verrucomicrobiota bacterium]HNU98494.1 hypothetical protein [Verrucomicrobiota bacterium]